MPERNQTLELGRQCFDRGDYPSSIQWFEQAEREARGAYDIEAELRACEWQVFAWGNIYNLHRMAECATRLLARARQLRNEFYEMVSALRLCDALSQIDLRNRWPEMKPLLLSGLYSARMSHWRFYEAYHLMRLGDCAVRMREDDMALGWLQDAINLFPGIDAVPRCLFPVNVYDSMSTLMINSHAFKEGLRYAEMAVGAAKQDANPGYLAFASLTLAKANKAVGELAVALEIAKDISGRAEANGWKGYEFKAKYLQGEVEIVLGHPDTAEGAAQSALQLACEMPMKEEEVKSLLILAQTFLLQKQYQEAHETLQKASRLSQERDYADHFHKAEEMLGGIKQWQR